MNSQKTSFLRYVSGTIISAVILGLLLPNYLVLAVETKLPTANINSGTLLTPQNGVTIIDKNNKAQSLQNKKQELLIYKKHKVQPYLNYLQIKKDSR
jgi:hypothetical protein